MTRLMSAMMPSCREVTRLLASGDEASSSWTRRAAVRLHLVMCRNCSRFARQLRLISQSLRDAWSPVSAGDIRMLKSRIVDRMRSL